jgi:hypothetical protein
MLDGEARGDVNFEDDREMRSTVFDVEPKSSSNFLPRVIIVRFCAEVFESISRMCRVRLTQPFKNVVWLMMPRSKIYKVLENAVQYAKMQHIEVWYGISCTLLAPHQKSKCVA